MTTEIETRTPAKYRRVLDDGRWFSVAGADIFDEATRFDGHNHISLSTGLQWVHERLYRTGGGKWVVYSWSQWEGSTESYRDVDDHEAARWLVLNEHEAHPVVADAIADLEVR